MRTFHLQRDEDETGVSGTGVVANGVIFPDGTVAMRWATATSSTAVYDSIDAVRAIHGHSGKTAIVTHPTSAEAWDEADRAARALCIDRAGTPTNPYRKETP